MAWGLEARVPFLDKSFLEVAMNIDPEAKMFSKGKLQQKDADGRPIMEKVSCKMYQQQRSNFKVFLCSIFFAKLLIVHQTAKLVFFTCSSRSPLTELLS